MNEKHYFWGVFFIVIGISFILYHSGLYFMNGFEYIYLVSAFFILLGLKLIFKKNYVKIFLTILISLTLSFTIVKFFGDTCYHFGNCCNVHYNWESYN
jgi:hypothetical protein